VLLLVVVAEVHKWPHVQIIQRTRPLRAVRAARERTAALARRTVLVDDLHAGHVLERSSDSLHRTIGRRFDREDASR
jgi:hypothetical protein